MKSILTIIILMLTQTLSFSQRKIKFDIIKQSGDTIFYTPDERIYVSAGDSYGSGRDKRSTVGDYLKTSVLKYTTGFVLQFAIQTGRTNSFSIYNGQYAKLFLNDGTTVTINSRNDYSSKKSSMGYGCWIFAYYTLTPSTIETLKTASVKSIRVETSMGTFDYPLKEKFWDTIAEQLRSF